MSDELEEELRYQQLRKLSRDVVPPATDEELAVIDRLFAARDRGVNGITWALEVYRAGRASRDAEVEELRAARPGTPLPPCVFHCGSRRVQILCRMCGGDRTDSLAALWRWPKPAPDWTEAERDASRANIARTMDRIWSGEPL